LTFTFTAIVCSKIIFPEPSSNWMHNSTSRDTSH